MKLFFSLFLSVFSAVSLLAEVNVLCTTAPVTLLAKAVIDGVGGYKVTTMLPAAIGCPHDYALTPQDMRKLAKADVIIINGLGMEDFLDGAIPRVNRKALVVDSSKATSSAAVPGAAKRCSFQTCSCLCSCLCACPYSEHSSSLSRNGRSPFTPFEESILAEKNYPSKVTDLVSRETKIPVLTLSVQPESGATPEAFLKLHRDNLEVIKAFYEK